MTSDVVDSFFLGAEEGRLPQPFRFLGETIFVKVSGADTTGRYTVMEETTPPQGGPPLHSHLREDEWLYVLDGSVLCEVGGHQNVARAGDSVFVPKGMAHTFQNIGNAPSRILAVIEPAGAMELFFSEMTSACAGGDPGPAVLAALLRKHGLELLGPPVAARGGVGASR